MVERPPPCNTGVATRTAATYTIVLDYLAAHLEDDAERVVDRLCAHLGTGRRLAAGMHGYSHCAQLCIGEDVWARVFFTPGGTPWLQASGTNAQPLEDAIRALGIPYRVTRKDAALDLYDADWFPVLVAVSKNHAVGSSPQLSVEHAGDWQYAQKGRTLYVGSRRSRTFLRLYEKGRKERADPNWIRAEVQYNPQNETEQRAAVNMTAAQVWTLRAFPVWGKAIGLDPTELFDYGAPTLPRVRRDQERARRALAQQYGAIITQWIRDSGGDPVAFVAELLHAIEKQQAARQWQSAPEINAQELQP